MKLKTRAVTALRARKEQPKEGRKVRGASGDDSDGVGERRMEMLWMKEGAMQKSRRRLLA